MPNRICAKSLGFWCILDYICRTIREIKEIKIKIHTEKTAVTLASANKLKVNFIHDLKTNLPR
jgi:hypothetical protein